MILVFCQIQSLTIFITFHSATALKCYVCELGQECSKSGGKGKETECGKDGKTCQKTTIPLESGGNCII